MVKDNRWNWNIDGGLEKKTIASMLNWLKINFCGYLKYPYSEEKDIDFFFFRVKGHYQAAITKYNRLSGS